MLVDGKVEGTGVCKLAFWFSSINNNKGFWFRLQGEGSETNSWVRGGIVSGLDNHELSG